MKTQTLLAVLILFHATWTCDGQENSTLMVATTSANQSQNATTIDSPSSNSNNDNSTQPYHTQSRTTKVFTNVTTIIQRSSVSPDVPIAKTCWKRQDSIACWAVPMTFSIIISVLIVIINSALMVYYNLILQLNKIEIRRISSQTSSKSEDKTVEDSNSGDIHPAPLPHLPQGRPDNEVTSDIPCDSQFSLIAEEHKSGGIMCDMKKPSEKPTQSIKPNKEKIINRSTKNDLVLKSPKADTTLNKIDEPNTKIQNNQNIVERKQIIERISRTAGTKSDKTTSEDSPTATKSPKSNETPNSSKSPKSETSPRATLAFSQTLTIEMPQSNVTTTDKP